jgi:hypothetical protein
VLYGRELDPLSLFINASVSWTHHFAGRPTEAISEALKTREIVPEFEEAGNVLIASYETLGEYENAAELISRQRCWGLTFDGKALAAAYRRDGARGYWLKRIELLQNMPDTEALPAASLANAMLHCRVGQFERAIDHVERMIDLHIGACVFLAVNPGLTPLHGQPRFEAALRRVGIPLQQTASATHTTST